MPAPNLGELKNRTKEDWVPKNNHSVSAPTVNDDAGDGYSMGSFWLEETKNLYVCIDPTTGAADWRIVAAF